jgi:hypothetical protein
MFVGVLTLDRRTMGFRPAVTSLELDDLVEHAEAAAAAEPLLAEARSRLQMAPLGLGQHVNSGGGRHWSSTAISDQEGDEANAPMTRRDHGDHRAGKPRCRVGVLRPMDSRKDSGMPDYCREQAKGSQDDEAGREAQRAADGVETLVQPGAVEKNLPTPNPISPRAGADPRHERPISGLPAPFSRELGAGVDHGGER